MSQHVESSVVLVGVGVVDCRPIPTDTKPWGHGGLRDGVLGLVCIPTDLAKNPGGTSGPAIALQRGVRYEVAS